jgi:hypothetical protein
MMTGLAPLVYNSSRHPGGLWAGRIVSLAIPTHKAAAI